MTRTNVLIVGAGPIGLELAAALHTAGEDYLHLEAGQIAQTVSRYPHQTRFFSSPERIAICGVPLQTPNQDKATREEYLAYLRGIVEQFDLQINTFERVTAIKRAAKGFLVQTRRGPEDHSYEAARIVLATGDLHRPRLLHIPGEDLAHVDHYFREPHQYFRQRLCIVGGRNSAVEAALRCYRTGAMITMSYRRAEFDRKGIKYWLLPEIESLIKNHRIDFHPRTVPVRISPTHLTLAAVNESGKPDSSDPIQVEADFVLLLTGYEMDTTLLEMAGVELEGENQAPKLDPRTMETNVENLFVIGTAAAGTQIRFRLFIENCHVHVKRVVQALTGREPCVPINSAGEDFALPES